MHIFPHSISQRYHFLRNTYLNKHTHKYIYMSVLMHVYLTHPPIHTNVCIVYNIQIYTYILCICIFVHVRVCMHTCIFSPKNLYCIYFSETYFYLPGNHVHIPTLFIITYVSDTLEIIIEFITNFSATDILQSTS